MSETARAGEPRDDGLAALEAVSAAVEAGASLPEVVRAASRALDASLVLADARGRQLAVAARSPADEQSLATDASGVDTLDLRRGDELVGRLRMRARGGTPPPTVLGVIRMLLAGEVERVRAPERASEEALAALVHALLGAERVAPDELRARAEALGVDLDAGGSVIVARALPLVPTEEDWGLRVLGVAQRGARAVAPSALVAPADRPDARAGEIVVVVPGADQALSRRVAESVLEELNASLQGFGFALGRSRVATQAELSRAGAEALLAANVAEADGADRRLLAFEDTGAYRLLLPYMTDQPDELQRFYAETLEPLTAYDDQYETDLVQTLETFLDCDGNVAQTAQRLYTHRHTIRYRLERVRELSGLDVGSSEGRERLSLGLKAMRVLGIAAPRGPATEAGAEAGRVPGGPQDRQR